MAYYTYTKDPIGAFTEKSAGNVFEYSINEDPIMEEWPHKVWIGSGQINDSGFRWALVKKTVAYVVVDENDYGEAVVEQWYIKKHREYA
jgi:hypothetical protein